MDNKSKPPGDQSADDAWGSLDESDDWRDRATGRGRVPERAQQTATNMRIRPEEMGSLQAIRGPHLVVVAGAEVGRLYPLRGPKMTVGRGEGNDVVLADGSVSREHARLELRQGRWHVVDLQSGNGTFVQAKRVRTAELQPGEQVAFGHVRLQLREARLQPGEGGRAPSAQADAGGAPALSPGLAPNRSGRDLAAKAPAPKPESKLAARPAAKSADGAPARRDGSSATGLTGLTALRAWVERSPELLQAAKGNRWARVGALSVVLVLLGVWGALVWEGRSAAATVFHLCQRGAKAFVAERFDEAEQALSEARSLLPRHPRVVVWTAALHRARSDQEHLSHARESLAAGNLGRARQALAQVATSPLFAKVEALSLELDRAEKALLVEAQTALAAGLQQEATALLGRLGAAEYQPPAGTEGTLVRADVRALGRWQVALADNAPLLGQIERFRARPHKKLSLWEQAGALSPALRRALGAFRSAHAAQAARVTLRALGHASGAKELQVASAMQRLDTLWESGLEEHRGKRAFAAIRVLTDAKQLALAVGGEGSTVERDINAKLADMYYVVGMQAFARQRLPEAAEALRVALALSPDHALSARRMEEIEDRAVRMVDHAEFIRKSHPARCKALLRQVSAAMPGNQEMGVRARKLLQEL